LLLWIACSLSPQEIRDRILDDPDFRESLLAWLEQCHRGDFSTGNIDDVRERINSGHAARRSAATAPDGMDNPGDDYTDPVLQFPTPPPTGFSVDHWYRTLEEISDDIVYRSNRHSESHSKGCKKTPDSICRARYPRELYPQTVIDPDSGAIRFKKTEAWINTFNPVLSFLLRCNTDVTCLLSGTQVRAIIAYVTDYISKGGFDPESVFNTIKSI
ncbi:hypothetical protein FOMPIDRAFT_1107226, partial [Fomitopsis schrenkii]